MAIWNLAVCTWLGLFHLSSDKHRLLPAAWRFVGTMNAAGPTAGPLLTFQQLLTSSLNTSLAGLCLFRIIDPANEFVTA
jgi:hypothetical protein